MIICHKGVRQTWRYIGLHLDVRRFKRFRIPDEWTIIDKYSFSKPIKIKGELDEFLEQKFWEGVKWYKKGLSSVIN